MILAMKVISLGFDMDSATREVEEISQEREEREAREEERREERRRGKRRGGKQRASSSEEEREEPYLAQVVGGKVGK